ncbi:MAG: heme o synthase [Vicinamibacteria bacterium]
MRSQAFTLSRTSLVDRIELTKPRITAMVVFTALVGFVTAADEPLRGAALAAALVGTGLVAAGAAVLNQVLERDTDALMERTRQRPLPAGRVLPAEAVAFGTGVTLAGHALLLAVCGPLPAAVAFVTWSSYLFVYTPLKRRTPLATLVGAVPGALPPVIGWTARTGSLDQGAFILFAILFLWQVPHFLAIAWLYRDDYARGGFPMLPVLDREGSFTARQAVVHSLALLLVSLLPFPAGLAGPVYLAGAALLGVALTLFAMRLLSQRTLPAARGLFLASVLYLPALSSLLLAAGR